jgi:hypothetical protein
MTKTMQVELPSGKKFLFGAPEDGGLREVSLSGKIKEAAAAQFEQALGTLGELIGALEKQVDGLAKRPSKVEIEFGASLSGDCDLWIVSGEGKAEFKVKLAWEAPKQGA